MVKPQTTLLHCLRLAANVGARRKRFLEQVATICRMQESLSFFADVGGWVLVGKDCGLPTSVVVCK